MIIYLAGPIHGRSDADAVVWRRLAKQMFEKDDYTVINPLDRDYRDGNAHHHMNEIILLDKRAIAKSDILIVMWDGTASVGTSMEMFYAWTLNKIILVVDLVKFGHRSPWLDYHATAVLPDLEAALEWLNDRTPC